jgi:E3 ubiquitin-protein ligase DOA10
MGSWVFVMLNIGQILIFKGYIPYYLAFEAFLYLKFFKLLIILSEDLTKAI